MTKQNKVNGCLGWFDLNNYEYLEDFHRSSWSVLIWSKSIVYKSLFADKAHLNPAYNKSVDASFILCELKRGQQLCNEEFEAISDYDFGQFALDYQDILLERKSKADFLKEIENECANYPFDFSDDTPQSYRDTAKPLDWLDFPSEADDVIGSRTIVLNTFHSDEEILKAVKEKLVQIRKADDEDGKQISDAEIRSIIDNRVVPYIDIMLWLELTGERLTQAQIAKLLFPDVYDVDIVAKLRQTTIPKAHKLLCERTPKFV